MPSLKYLLQKEFTQIRRNKFMARMIIFVPIVQMLILVPVVTFDIKQINSDPRDKTRVKTVAF